MVDIRNKVVYNYVLHIVVLYYYYCILSFYNKDTGIEAVFLWQYFSIAYQEKSFQSYEDLYMPSQSQATFSTT